MWGYSVETQPENAAHEKVIDGEPLLTAVKFDSRFIESYGQTVCQPIPPGGFQNFESKSGVVPWIDSEAAMELTAVPENSTWVAASLAALLILWKTLKRYRLTGETKAGTG